MKKKLMLLSCLFCCGVPLCSCEKEEKSPTININNYEKYTETLYYQVNGYNVMEIRTTNHYLFCNDVYFIATVEKYNGEKENVHLLPSDYKYNYNGVAYTHDFSIRTSDKEKRVYLIEVGGTLQKMD